MEKIKFVDVEENKLLRKSGFYVQFNPEKMTIKERCVGTQNMQFRPNETGQESVETQVSSQEDVTLTLQLFFNSLTSFEQIFHSDVRKAIAQFYRYTDPEDKIVRQVGVLYGAMAIVGFITSMSVTYTLFDTEGRALRAEVDLTISGHHHGKQVQHSLEDSRMAHESILSFTESLLAYGTAVHWKSLAKALHVESPFLK